LKLYALTVAVASISAAAELSVVAGGELRTEFYDYLTAQAQKHWTDRKAKVAGLSSPAAVRQRQEFIRKWMANTMGGFPEKTPLNARVTGGFERDGYRVEHLVFESLPKFYVTANVYVPTNAKPPFPAVIGVAGHSATGKAIATYQHAWIGLVKRGFLVLAFDPPGQGERLEYLDPSGSKSTVGVGTREHNMAGAQCLLTGTTFARYEAWDGIRAFDYLLTRRDIDPKRIGVAGNSGGGTQSAYLAVVEPRLAAAVISCYMTDWEHLWKSPGPQDAEQNFPGFLSSGLNFGDFMIAFAPKPVTMLTGIRDYFPIAGGRQTYAEAKRVFGVLNAEDKAGYFEYDDEHGWHKPRREATYRWFTKWLQGKQDDGAETEIKPEPEANLNVTPTGQVANSLRGETVRSLNAALAEKIYPKRTAATATDPAKMRDVIARVLNIQSRSGVPAASAIGSEDSDGTKVTKLIIQTETGIRVPALMWTPAGTGKHPAIIYVNSAGKSADTEAIRKLTEAGNVVLALDPRGWGESAPQQKSGGYTPDWQLAQRAMLIGKPLVGMQTFDVLRTFDYVATLPDVDASRISVSGVGDGAAVALYAGALEPRIASVTAINGLASYMTAVRADTHKGLIGVVVPGVLREFDLPDVAAGIAPRPLRLAGLRDALGNPLPGTAAEEAYKSTKRRYADLGRSQALTLAE
jgi:cephalosporin-C deacetylase-like acetyl esterase